MWRISQFIVNKYRRPYDEYGYTALMRINDQVNGYYGFKDNNYTCNYYYRYGKSKFLALTEI